MAEKIKLDENLTINQVLNLTGRGQKGTLKANIQKAGLSLDDKFSSLRDNEFLKKLDEIEGYFVCDVWQFPKVPYITISSHTIREYYFSGKLGKATKVTRKTFFNLFGEL